MRCVDIAFHLTSTLVFRRISELTVAEALSCVSI